ncbi:iron ABC transporter substrate-binding protein [Desulfothermobacter acidiphilus]|uniref:iron ABC transporter substrate-binding protein n=1 Tax=Desulfothermobacter acidiphilus TaxID=1938353 RepID=UPI003F890559
MGLVVRRLGVWVLVLLLALMAGCGGKSPQGASPGATPAKLKLTDLLGREVEVPVPAQRVVALGPGALRLVCYVNGTTKVVGVEDFEKKNPAGRPYILAHPELKDLPSAGPGGPQSSPDPERIVSLKPDVIFITYLVDKSQADRLQAQTGIPVVMLSYGQLATFGDEVYDSLKLIGKIIGEEKRAEEVVSFFQGNIQELQKRTQDIPADQKPTVYVGALGMRGTHGIESTQAQFPLFRFIGARNVADETGLKGSVMIEREKLLSWNPDIIIIDEAGLGLVKEDYKKNPSFYQSLKAFKEGKVYGMLPFNFYTTNLDTALADAYWLGKVIYPDKFQDIDPVKQADAIYTFLLGKPLYAQMAKDFGGFEKINLAQ